jgi:flagellar biosynthesis GTPase FlhF
MEKSTKKKWLWGIGIILVLAAIGSMQEKKDGSESKTPQQTERLAEQPQETEAERQEREQKAEAERQEREQKAEAERQEREQKAEAERQAREQKEKESQIDNKKKEVAEYGYKRGYERGFEGRSDVIGNPITIQYTTKYGAPASSEEKELFNLFRENWKRGYEEGKKMRYSN